MLWPFSEAVLRSLRPTFTEIFCGVHYEIMQENNNDITEIRKRNNINKTCNLLFMEYLLNKNHKTSRTNLKKNRKLYNFQETF